MNMKKIISVFLAVFMTLAVSVTAFAAEPDGSKTITELPGSVDIPVTLNADLTPGSKGPVQDGKVTVTGPGFTAEDDNAPHGAVRLVVVPITDDEALAWFDGCVGSRWSVTGTIYAVFYEDAEGNRMEASGVRMTVEIPAGYEKIDVFSVDTDETTGRLNYMASGTSVTYTTDGRLYSGVVRRRGIVDEQTSIGPGAPDITLNMTPEEIADAVLSDEEQNYLDDGIDIHIRLEVKDITDTVSAADKQAVESVATGYTVGKYIDIELLKQIGDRPWENVHETNKPIRITITIPENLLGAEGREFALACVHNGKGYLLKDLDNDPTTVTVETSQFSTYAILYRDPGSTNPDNPGGTTPDNPGGTTPDNPGGSTTDSPQTGYYSNISLWLAIVCVGAAGLFLVLFYYKKRKKEE